MSTTKKADPPLAVPHCQWYTRYKDKASKEFAKMMWHNKRHGTVDKDAMPEVTFPINTKL
jgi:hypothetical protein